MIRFEVTGETPEQFAENAFKAWALLAAGFQNMFSTPNALTGPQPQPALAQSIQSATDFPKQSTLLLKNSTEAPVAETHGSESSSSASKAHSDPVDDLFTEAKPAGRSKNSKGPKLDDLKTRLSDVITAAVGRGWSVPRANAYAKKLLREVNADKLGDIKHEEYADFLDLSEGYLRGTCSETA